MELLHQDMTPIESGADSAATLFAPVDLHLRALAYAQSGDLVNATKELECLMANSEAPPTALRDLGLVAYVSKDFTKAANCFSRYLADNPNDFEALWGLARTKASLAEFEEAKAAALRAFDAAPENAGLHLWMAKFYRTAGQLHGACFHQWKYVQLHPEDSVRREMLAIDFFKADNLDDSIQACKALHSAGSMSKEMHSFYLYASLFDLRQTPESLFRIYQDWFAQHEVASPHFVRHYNWDPNRKLHIGYLSGELMQGPAFCSLSPIFAHRNYKDFEITVYHTRTSFDDHSAWYRDRVESWKDCSSINDDTLFQMIGDDKIDILVDLAGHFPENKQQVLARRAAPIQIAHPVFPSTRANPSIDYIITDQWTLPKELEPYLTEEPLRLPGGCMAFAPPPESPDVTHLPAIKNGFITFGLFQRRNKLNQRTLDLAGAVLLACPESVLLIHHGDPELEDEDSPSQVSLIAEFERRGIDGSRIKFLGALSRNLAMAAMAQADIALDSTPFCGHTTTSECLWMGVPVVTLAGEFYQSRVSTAMLHQIGLGDLSTRNEEQYVATAVRLASNIPALSKLRATMRRRIESSPFLGGPRLATELENAYRDVWRQVCLSNSQIKEQKNTDAN